MSDQQIFFVDQFSNVNSVIGMHGVTASPTTGNVVVSGVNATTSTVGVASFNPLQFTVTSGEVSLLQTEDQWIQSATTGPFTLPPFTAYAFTALSTVTLDLTATQPFGVTNEIFAISAQFIIRLRAGETLYGVDSSSTGPTVPATSGYVESNNTFAYCKLLSMGSGTWAMIESQGNFTFA